MDTTLETKQSRVTTTVNSESIVVRFSGDSGDGMQLTGMQFTDTSALLGKDISTFPEYPAEIRAPAGTLAGVSGFQVHFGSKEIFTPGDFYDVIVCMNAAALKTDLERLKKHGVVIANVSGFDSKNMKLAGYPEGSTNPLEDGTLDGYKVYRVDVSKLTKEALKESGLGMKEIERSKNMFVLGLLFWMFDNSMEFTIKSLEEKFGKKPDILAANLKVLKAGWNYGDTTEVFTTRYKTTAAQLTPGVYRNISGNQALSIGILAAAEKAGLPIFLGSYPITPASDVLHDLSKFKSNGVKTFQAEDEIAAICSAIGAAYTGSLGVTSTSGPGVALKSEAMSLAMIFEIPLLICDIQRGGPSTGLPTKTEQADLMMAMYGRHGESPLPIIAANSPADCFDAVYEAVKISIEHMVPVIFLSDGYIANGAEPWRFPTEDQLAPINATFLTENNNPGGKLLPYKRDANGVRPWIKPGTKGLEHRIGGLEKQEDTGNVSYDSKNHERMVHLRAAKVEKIADFIPLIKPDSGPTKGKMCVLGWGSTYGAIKTALLELNQEGYKDIAHVHVRHMNPFPKNLGELLHSYEKVLVPEMNTGQLILLVRAKYLVPAVGLNKVQGQPFTTEEVKTKIVELYNS
ncbi:MAG: 2-oxoacid:acceptor oxidoreductase subunit alpha [Bacteroidetes bacterium]|nr:2-oxoacid:acceptor oxidoreductase subunit alpha [Bacteroidota bacterium]